MQKVPGADGTGHSEYLTGVGPMMNKAAVGVGAWGRGLSS